MTFTWVFFGLGVEFLPGVRGVGSGLAGGKGLHVVGWFGEGIGNHGSISKVID